MPAGAMPAALNTTVLEYSGSGPSYIQTLPTTEVSQSNGTVEVDALSNSGQVTMVLKITAPGGQAPAPKTEYDSADGSTITISAPGTPSGPCGAGSQDDADVYIDQAVYNTSGQPTTFGVEFNFDCPNSSGVDEQLFGTAAFNLFPTTPRQGYYIYGNDGSLGGFGNDSYLDYLGDLSATTLNQPIVGMATTPDGGGYWMVASDGGIFAFGDAQFHGSTGNIALNKPIVGMASTPSGNGYWLVASDGGIFSFGDAQFHGSTGNITLNKPIVGMASTPSGNGYWMVATDGGIFSFGDANFHGSTGAIKLNQPIVGMTPTVDGGGYWLAAADGGIFTFGDATFDGSLGGLGITNAVGITH
jgi:hypothetical protein